MHVGNVRIRTVPKKVCDELNEAVVMAREQVVTTNSGSCMLSPENAISDSMS